MYNKEVPIKQHSYADMEKGTGLVMMASMGDLGDIRFFREMNIDPIIAIEKDGTMNHHAGFLRGLKVRDARKKIIEELRQKGLLAGQTQINHKTPVSERSGMEIEFIEMKEFYLRQMNLKETMLNIANKVNFYAPESKQILTNWINSIAIDWPLSRRRYYATEVPLWYCENCNHIILPEKGSYYQPWKENPPIKECPKCKSNKFIGETRVFDTWFDSSISPLYILGYERDTKFFKKNNVCSLRPQGKEIVRTWLYYTLLRGYLARGKPIFKDAWINYHITDEKGHKMSKSKGNGIDPREVIEKFGAEPFRLWAAIEGNLEKTDFKCSLERIDGASKTITKLWNIARFISMFPEKNKPKKVLALDRWIINELNAIIILANERYIQYDFHNPAISLKHFIWEPFASHYLELVKARAYNQDNSFTKEEQDSALYTLHYCLDQILKLLAPITPMVAYSIYRQLRQKDIHFENFAKPTKAKKQDFAAEELIEINKGIWKLKKDSNMSLKSEIKKASIHEKFKVIQKDIKATHNIKELSYGEFKINF